MLTINDMNNYHISFEYFGEKYDIDCIAFDKDVTYKECLTIYIKDAFRIVVDLFNVKNLNITPIK